jgi:TRAP-type mannitol/chloroaromatic compound transport system permease small subunit
VNAFLEGYVRRVEAFNYRVGRFAMYLIFAMIGILGWSSISKTFFLPSLWTLEMAQFTMMAYFVLGGAYSIQMGSNVRMDLLYGGWSDRRKAAFDAVTVLFLIFFLGVVFYGGWLSTAYSIEYGERTRTAWRPYMWPIKAVMMAGVLLMLLQALAELCRDILKLRGRRELPRPGRHAPDDAVPGEAVR